MRTERLSELSHGEQEVGMERFGFGDDVAFVPRGDLLDGATVAPLTQPFEEPDRPPQIERPPLGSAQAKRSSCTRVKTTR